VGSNAGAYQMSSIPAANSVKMYLGAGTAGTSVTHLPEIVLHVPRNNSKQKRNKIYTIFKCETAKQIFVCINESSEILIIDTAH
jgi:hypothetical protein